MAKTLIDCKVLCIKKGDELINGDDEDMWLDCCLDFAHIIAIKVNGSGSENENKAAIYMVDGESPFIIDMDYSVAIHIWKQFKSI